MANDANNPIWGPVANARTLLSNSSTFQTLVGEATAGAAAAHIYTPGITPGDIAAARPFAVVDQGSEREMVRNSTDGFTDAGSIFFLLEADVADGNLGQTKAKWEAAHKAFLGALGDIIADMIATSHGPGYLYMTGFRLIFGPQRSEDTGEGDFYQAICEIQWRTV